MQASDWPSVCAQIVKQRTPDGRLANVVQCTEESSMRMDPREVGNTFALLSFTGMLSVACLVCRVSLLVWSAGSR